ncbi:hypothetical protein CHARACLAT_005687 [Characodon lateralis]|uniref:TBC1 domain family member 30 n=1 Tax=Characodon lateralis TaxID=208331 RepID=A0ABU7F3N9_9TELE|nr:hypothetical protein [Characodon lateralis]
MRPSSFLSANDLTQVLTLSTDASCLNPCFLLPPSDLQELRSIIQEVKYRSGLQSTKLIRQLKRRDRLHQKRQKNYDIITACLQAVSQKRRKTEKVFYYLIWTECC